MDFMNNMVKSSNSLIRDKLSNVNIPFGNKQQSQQETVATNQSTTEQSSDSNLWASSSQTGTDFEVSGNDSNPNNASNLNSTTFSDQQQTSDNQRGAKQQFSAIAADAEAVTQKAVSGAKNIGSFLFSMANKAGQTVSQTAKQVKQAVENTTILTDFTKEQQDFIKEHGSDLQCGQLPWMQQSELLTGDKRTDMREQILSLSQDRRNFVKGPPANDPNYTFDTDKCYPIALALLKEDPNLGKMRSELVPKLISEEAFWCNYFYRVEKLRLMIESDGGDESGTQWASNKSSSSEGPDEDASQDIESQLSQAN